MEKTTLILAQTHHLLADFNSIRSDILGRWKNHAETPGKKIILYPELALCGYPLQDLCLQKSFYQKYLANLKSIQEDFAKLPINSQQVMLLGGIEYIFGQGSDIPCKLYNVLYALEAQKPLSIVYKKMLLPNYDIFDEKKYFTPGEIPGFWQWQGLNIGLLICEDMWATPLHENDPCSALYHQISTQNITLDLILNASASPFYTGKHSQRLERAKQISHMFSAPFAYVNRVGAEDEILFDGKSFVVSSSDILAELSAFKADEKSWVLPSKTSITSKTPFAAQEEHTWEMLFRADLDENEKNFHPSLCRWSDEECAEVVMALQFGLQEYAKKSGMKNFLVALSGGIDSGLVLALCKLSLKPEQQVEAIFMPGQHTTELSMQLASEICNRLKVTLKHLPIKFLHSISKNLYKEHLSMELSGVSDENMQSRLRGLLLYTRSNQTGAMVINTSNKSELAVGYSTQYGDSVGALSIIGDLFKTQVYRLCEYLNQIHGDIIPKEMISRAPTAELRPKQTDEDSLLPYQELDPMLECILSYRYSEDDLIELGFKPASIHKILRLYTLSEYKRKQFCPILKVRPKSFGFGYRVPICKNRSIYTTID